VNTENDGAQTLLDRLYSYRASMAPHHRDQQGGKLLLEAIEEIERLQKQLRETCGVQCAGSDGEAIRADVKGSRTLE
jgi:hypothetical protein